MSVQKSRGPDPFHVIIQRVSDPDGSTAWTAMATAVDPSKMAPDAMQLAGYTGDRAVIVAVFTGAEVHADHDIHRLVRQTNGRNDWAITPLKALKSDARAVLDDKLLS